MTLRGAGEHIRVLLFGSTAQRRSTLHLVRMICRGIDLSGASAESLGLDEEKAYRYGNSGGPCLEAVLDALPITREDCVLDIGCGKGGALLTLAQYPFARVDGIELSGQLARVAEKNLKRAGVRNARVFHGDAVEFRHYADYTYLYMYNPFPEPVLEEVLRKVRYSLEQRPRALRLVYYNPVCHAAVLRAGFRKTGEYPNGRLRFRTYEI